MKRYGIVPRKENRKMKISGTIDDDLYKWMQKRIGDRSFYNQSHAIELGLKKLKEDEMEKRR